MVIIPRYNDQRRRLLVPSLDSRNVIMEAASLSYQASRQTKIGDITMAMGNKKWRWADYIKRRTDKRQTSKVTQ